jgi:hypothetical protein
MSTLNEEATNLIGEIKVVDMEEQPDGSWKVIFEYDKKFKDEYKRLFNLKRFSKKHFQENLDKAVDHFKKTVESEAGFLKLREEIIHPKED